MVDDLLISTDVDKIIRILKDKRKMDLHELSREAKMREPTLEKWVEVLEEQGLVKIDYKLTKIFVIWTGETEEKRGILPKLPLKPIKIPGIEYFKLGKPKKQEKKEEPMQEKKIEEKKPGPAPKPEKIEEPEPVRIQPVVDMTVVEEATPANPQVEKVKVEVTPKENGGKEEKDKKQVKPKAEPKNDTKKEVKIEPSAVKKIDIKKKPAALKREKKMAASPLGIKIREAKEDIESIKSSIETEMNKKQEPPKYDIKIKEPAKTQEDEMQLPEKLDINVNHDEGKEEQQGQEKRRMKIKQSGTAGELQKKLQEINEQARGISELKGNKENLYREVLEPLENKFEAELDVISDKLIEKEQAILSLQQRAINLPNVVEDMEGNYMKLAELEEEVKRTFDDSSIRIDELLDELRGLHGDSYEKIGEARRKLHDEVVGLDDMQGKLSELQTLEAEARERVNEAKARIAEQNQMLDAVTGSLEGLNEAQTDIAGNISTTRGSIEKQLAALKDMEKEISRISQVDNWVSTHKSEYESKIDEFAGYVKESEKDYEKLRGAVEANFVRRYLKELKEKTSAYEFELEQAIAKEKSIDEKIVEPRQKLQQLIGEGRELADAFESGAASDIDPIQDAEVKDIISKKDLIYASMSAKSKERKNLEKELGSIASGEKLPEPKKINIPKSTGKKKAKKPAKKKAKAKKPPRKGGKEGKLKAKKSAKKKPKRTSKRAGKKPSSKKKGKGRK